jgi:hypothetical protein
MLYTLAVFLILGFIIAVVLIRKSTYYKTVFSSQHYVEIHQWLVAALKTPPAEMPSLETGTAFQTSAGIALALSQINQADLFQLHISISETRGITTNAIAGRIAFLVFYALNKNKCSADLFFTLSGVHHIVLSKDSADWLVRDEVESIGTINNYSPLPFRLENIES